MKKYMIGLIVVIIAIMTGCNKEESGTEMLIGTWNGAIQVPSQPLDIILNFNSNDDLTGTISIPVQNVDEFELTQINLKEDTVTFKMPLSGQNIYFKGKLDDDKISGTFTQQGKSFPFEVVRGEPKTDQSEEEENFLTIESPTGKLYGSLLTSEKSGPTPIAIIIPGSGPTDRNGNSPLLPGKNNSLKLLAEGLSEQGIASLRYDKRGAGKNAQAITKEEDLRFETFVDDAKQWINKLEEDERFSDIYVIGHSQGSLVGMLAAQDSSADAFISIAGAGRSIDQVLAEQLATLPEELLKESEQILASLKRGKTVNEVDTQLMNVFKPRIQPFLISWMKYDPTKEIEKLSIPTMIINGKNDIQVPAMDAELLAKAKPKAELLLIDQMNHVLKEAPAVREKNLATYSDPTLPLAEGLLSGIKKFLK
ncbi:alpha/beta hydrolase [Pseudalkalibacillus berkeleyi]|uniref:Lysophospholipase n=1 Tax=Pseudalkalibacillus berkeleyi TaxID=1069813 RepID=A0ABS9GXN0_9BACL|nr:alpha/beta fold hydrolase [Pseudalkalibacillus berkeleyi]MCF6136496.1 lysophospholipase [Pseudalkalibacillus berkeleyi]